MENNKLSETEKEKLRLLIINELPDQWDKFDIDAEIDSSLSFEENKNIILEKIDVLREKEINLDAVQENKIMSNIQNMRIRERTFWYDILHNIRVLIVYGGTGTGKTALAFSILQKFKKPVYIYKHPNKKLITSMGYIPIETLEILNNKNGIIIYIDEPQIHLPKYDKTSNDMFEAICSLARQRDITLIISTSDTRWVNRGLESYVTHWAIKDIDPKLIKNGSTAKNIIKDFCINFDDFKLEIDEYIFYSRKDDQHNGKYRFQKPIYFDDKLSKAYQNN